MQVEGITWHGVILAPDQFAAMMALCKQRAVNSCATSSAFLK